jgi:hypothetical protein
LLKFGAPPLRQIGGIGTNDSIYCTTKKGGVVKLATELASRIFV